MLGEILHSKAEYK